MAYFTTRRLLAQAAATISSAILTLTLMAGCSSNEENNEQYTIANINSPSPIHIYTSTAIAKDDIDALNEATHVAVKLCATNDERADILDHRVKYQGMTDKQKNIVTQANTELNKSIGTFSERDYKVTVRFRCLPREQDKSLIKIANQMSGDQVVKVVK